MTFNLISDLHCGYDQLRDNVVWNRKPEDESYVLNRLKKSEQEILRVLTNIQKNYDTLKNKTPQKNIDNPAYRLDKRVGSIKDLNQCVLLLHKVLEFIHGKRRLYKDLIFDLDKIGFFLDSIDVQFSKYLVQMTCWRFECEFKPEKLKSADYLLIAGDLGLDESYEKVYEDIKKRTSKKFKDIFYIKGNHDYWKFGKDRWESLINLDHRFIEHELGDNVVLLGCTLWSPIPENNKWSVRRGMNDYNYIPAFTPEKSTELYRTENAWLKERVNLHKGRGKKVVVMTHHLPREEIVDDKFMHSDVNAAYCVLDHSCDNIQPDIWVHGHSHNYSDHTINGVRYLRNPIGYREHYGYVPSECPPTHWYNTVIEV